MRPDERFKVKDVLSLFMIIFIIRTVPKMMYIIVEMSTPQ